MTFVRIPPICLCGHNEHDDDGKCTHDRSACDCTDERHATKIVVWLRGMNEDDWERIHESLIGENGTSEVELMQ